MSPSRVAWSRPVRDRHNDLTYTSKCGRFTIERRDYVLPVTSVSYILLDTKDGGKTECDSLADAKGTANEIVAEEG